jgi:hypothetical protein
LFVGGGGETDIVFKNPGPVLAMINEWYRIAADGLGVQTDFNQVMEQKLLSAGFDQVKVLVYDIPIGEWSNDPGKPENLETQTFEYASAHPSFLFFT